MKVSLDYFKDWLKEGNKEAIFAQDRTDAIKNIRKWVSNGGKVATFCAGQNGYTFYRILNLLDIKVDCIVDNNASKWNQKVFDDMVCYSPTVLSGREDYLTYICISPQFYHEIYKQAKQSNILHIENVYDIMIDIAKNYKDIYFKILSELPYGRCLDFFYDSKCCIDAEKLKYAKSINERIAVYTSVFGTYDNVYEPQYIAENIDYYFVSEQRPADLKKYKWLDAKNFLPSEMESSIDKNRYIKMHPHLLFPQYNYSIYIDGNVEVLKDISLFVQKSKTGISVFRHPSRDDIYMEALAVVNAGKSKSETVQAQMEKYIGDGFPHNYGLAEMRIIAREHNNPICIKVMEDWWEEFSVTNTKRDQLSFMYVIWKNGFKLTDMFVLGQDMKNHDSLKIYDHIE